MAASSIVMSPSEATVTHSVRNLAIVPQAPAGRRNMLAEGGGRTIPASRHAEASGGAGLCAHRYGAACKFRSLSGTSLRHRLHFCISVRKLTLSARISSIRRAHWSTRYGRLSARDTMPKRESYQKTNQGVHGEEPPLVS